RGEHVATIDVCSNYGTQILAKQKITASDLLKGNIRFALPFSVPFRSPLEYRVATLGKATLRIDESRRVHRVRVGTDIQAVLDADQFPSAEGA
ncbi:hypothetical protein OLF82_10800, partial [Streptococcus pneumoniae]|nr:hypothetical protein [Streptococcus pneumoniae]